MRMHDIEMLILVKNRSIVEYEHKDQVFIEGRSGSNYEIELRNNNHFRVEAILSVDGLSVIDGKEAGPNSRSYMIPARGTLRVPGWLLDSGTAAKFAFAEKQAAYAAKSGTGSQNVGVIGALIYREKWTYPISSWGVGSPMINNTNLSYHGITTSCASTNTNVCPTTTTFQQALGTAFGDATDFSTKLVAFERGDQLAIMTLFYDNMRGLRARGVPIERKPKVFSQPNAFPGLVGCIPPRGWSASGLSKI